MLAKRTLFALAKALEGVPVLGALPSSPAARAGIRYGDILLSVNGVRTRSIADYIEAKARRTEGMEIVVFRGGAERAEMLTFDEDREPPDMTAILAGVVTLRVGGVLDADGGESDTEVHLACLERVDLRVQFDHLVSAVICAIS